MLKVPIIYAFTKGRYYQHMGYGTRTIGRVQKIAVEKYQPQVSEGKPTRMRRLCLKTSEAEGQGGLGITSSSKEVYELML